MVQIHPKYLLHPNRPTLTTPDSFHERQIPVKDVSAPAAIIDLTLGDVSSGGFEEGERIHDINKGNE